MAATKSASKAPRAAKAAPAAPAPVAAPAAPTTGVRALLAAKLAATPALAKAVHGAVPVVQLPPSIAIKGASMGAPSAKLATVVLVPGKAYICRSAHNAQWAALACKLAAKGATAQALVAGGVPAHSVAAYVKRGWLVAAK